MGLLCFEIFKNLLARRSPFLETDEQLLLLELLEELELEYKKKKVKNISYTMLQPARTATATGTTATTKAKNHSY